MNIKSVFRPKLLPYLTLITGAVCFIMRFFLMHYGMDEKGLLIETHPLNILLYIFSALFLAALVMCILPLKGGTSRYHRLFPKSVFSAVGCLFAASGALITYAGQLLNKMDTMSTITLVLAFLVAVCFGFLGFARQKGKRPHYLLHAGITLFLMFHLICQYQAWSPEPQLHLYLPQLLASVFLLLTAYQAVCLDIHKGDRRQYALYNQAALFFCFLSLTDTNLFFYLGMGVWTGTNLCSLHISRHHTAEEKQEPEDTNEASRSEEA